MTLSFLLVALLAAPPVAPEALYRAGSDAYRAGRYDVAITAFEAALAVAERPDLLFSVAQAHRLQYFSRGGSAHLEAAVDAYRGYLEQVPDGRRRVHAAQHLSTLVPYLDRLRIERAQGAAAERDALARIIVTSAVPDARARIDEGVAQPIPAAFEVEPGTHRVEVFAELHAPVMRDVASVAGAAVALALDPTPIPARLTLRAPAGARIVVDGDTVGRAPLDAPIELMPGAHDLVVLDRGRRPVLRPLDVRRAEVLELVVALEPTTQRWMAIGALGLSAGLGLAGASTGYFAWDARAEAEAIEARVGAGLTASDLGRYRDLEQQRDTLRDLTVGLGVAATSLVATGVALWIFDDPAPPPRARRSPAPLEDERFSERAGGPVTAPRGASAPASGSMRAP